MAGRRRRIRQCDDQRVDRRVLSLLDWRPGVFRAPEGLADLLAWRQHRCPPGHPARLHRPQPRKSHAVPRTAHKFAALFTLLAAACFIVFGDLSLIPIQLHVLAFAVLPFVMWAAISFGIGGASLAVFTIATTATIATAFGLGPFAGSSSFTNAVLLDVLFAVLAVSGLSLGAVIAERERAKDDREALVREQAANETRLRERAEESVSRLSRRLFHAQEQERARIARELHDDIGQRCRAAGRRVGAVIAERARRGSAGRDRQAGAASRRDRDRHPGVVARAALGEARVAGNRDCHEGVL